MAYKMHFIKWKFTDNDEEILLSYILCDNPYETSSDTWNKIRISKGTRQDVLNAVENEFGFDALALAKFLCNVDRINYVSVSNLQSLCPLASIPEHFGRNIDVTVDSTTYNFRYRISSNIAGFETKGDFNVWGSVDTAGYTTSYSSSHSAIFHIPVLRATDINDPTTILDKYPMFLEVTCSNDYDVDTYEYYYYCNFQWRDAGGISIYQRNFLNAIKGSPDITPTPPGPEPSDDPYSQGGYSGTGGGPAPTGGTGTTGNGGLHDDSSDAIPTPSLPSDVSVSSGLFTAYNPSASQLASFANALWNMQVEDINDVLRFLFGGDAFNAVIGLHLLPVSPATSGSQSIKLGNWDTKVSAPKISSQYAQVSFGSILLPEYWGNCIDYAPYTKIQLALPYIGIVDVNTDDVLGSTNTLTYNIDVLSGAICATLHCVKFNLSSVIYQWSGACAVSLPFSGASYNSVIGAIAGVAAAGMGFASMAAGPIGAALPAAALAAGGGAFGAGSAASIMGTMKGKVQKSGSFGANSGALGIMTPYFILTRPVQSVPETWQADKGYPANISAQLGTLTGYTEVSEINLECSGTEAEKEEIIKLLKSGVIF